MNYATREEIARAEDLRRLANQAERAGVPVLVDYTTGAHIATSV